LWQAVLDDLSLFFDDLSGPVVVHGADQNSYYRDPADSSPMGDFFLQEFGWMAGVQDMPGYDYFDYLTNTVDPEFLLAAEGPNAFSANFAGGNVSVQGLGDGSTFAFALKGITVLGTWHEGGPVTAVGNDIIVTGGHWTFQYTGFDGNYYSGNPLPGPPQIAAPAEVAAVTADPEAVAETHRQNLSAQLHDLLDRNGGHVTVTFKGPNGNETFDLADFLNILDHYHVTATSATYVGSTVGSTGGAGSVHPDGHGGWVTEINRAQLVAYETAYNMLDFLILHEVSHMMSNALSFTDSQFQSWLASGQTRETYLGTNGFDASAALYRGESYVNDMAAAVEVKLDITPPQHPPGGYDYTGTYGG
jgi:hypothetical protein